MIRKIYNTCWYLVGGLILLTAVCVTIIRLLLPGIDDYRQDIESLVTHYSGYPISIDSVSAEWRGWKPRLFLQGVTLLEPDDYQPIASFSSARVSFALFNSLLEGQIIPESLVVSGASLKLVRGKNGSIRFGDQSIQNINGDDNDNINAELTRWLLAQRMISLDQTSILWVDELYGRAPLQLRNASLHLRTWRDRIQINGTAEFPASHGDSVLFSLDATGNLLSGEWSGRGYLQASELRPAAWPDYSRWRNLSVAAGDADIRIWSEWENARLTSAHGHLAAEDSLLHGHGHNRLIRYLEADFRLLRMPKGGWSFQTTLHNMSTWNGKWPLTRIHLDLDADDRIETAYFSHIRLEDVLPLSGLDELLPERFGKNYGIESVHGELHGLEYRHKADSDSQTVSGRFVESGFTDRIRQQGIQGLSGEFIFTEDRGRLRMSSHAARIDDPELFESSISNIAVDGTIDWYRNAEANIHLSTENLSIDTDPHILRLRGTAIFDGKTMPRLDIVASLSEGEAEPLKRLIPAAAKDKLKRWLNRSIAGGKLQFASMALRGDLDDFPFNESQGQFKINARFNEITMDYHPEWPPIYQIDGDVVVERDVLSVHVPSADIYQSRLKDVTGVIKRLYEKDHVLYINGEARGSTDDAITFLKDSPLRNKATIRRLFNLDIDGDVRIALDMDLALFPEGDDVISGTIELPGNRMHSSRWGIELEDIRGNVLFTGDRIRSDGLVANYFDIPVQLDISRPANRDDAPTVFGMTGSLDADALVRVMTEKIPDATFPADDLGNRLDGQSSWRAELVLHPDDTSRESFNIRSNLRGTSIDLPAPLGKTADSEREFELEIDLPPVSEPLKTLRLQFADILSARYADNGLSIAFGNARIPSPSTRRLQVTGQIGELDMDGWLNLIRKYQPLPGQETNGDDWATEADLVVEQLDMYHQRFDSVRLFARKSIDQWQVEFDGSAIDGRASIPRDASAEPLFAKFRKLELRPVESENPAQDPQSPDPAGLPPLDIEIQELTYNDSDFGKFSLEADKTKTGLRIKRFSFSKPSLLIQGEGKWHKVNGEIFSQFSIELEAEAITEMLTTFEYYDESIEGGETKIGIEALWPGSPMDYSLADMTGSMALNIVKGTFLNIDPKAGRLFGLLSLQSLPRRLSLDFSDLFNEGFAFDRIHGTFTIEGGHAYTNDLTMEGPSALITVTGRTGLIDRTYDQVVTVVPQLSDSLPVASALFGPVGIGVGAVIFLTGKVFKSIPEQIDRMLGYQYSVTGSWEDPIVERLTEQRESAPPGLAEEG